LEQAVALELAQVIAELVEAVGLFGQVEGGEDCPPQKLPA